MTQATTQDTASYQAELSVSAEPERVLRALTTLEGLSGWWSPVTGTTETGGELQFVHKNPEPLVVEVVQADESGVRWHVLDYPGDPEWIDTSISFVLSRTPTGTRGEFAHDGLTPALECFEWCSPGWDYFLASFVRYLETGTGNPLP
jgi:hypothetical protein